MLYLSNNKPEYCALTFPPSPATSSFSALPVLPLSPVGWLTLLPLPESLPATDPLLHFFVSHRFFSPKFVFVAKSGPTIYEISAPRLRFAPSRSRAFVKCPQSRKKSHFHASMKWLFITPFQALISLLSRKLLDDCSNTAWMYLCFHALPCIITQIGFFQAFLICTMQYPYALSSAYLLQICCKSTNLLQIYVRPFLGTLS